MRRKICMAGLSCSLCSLLSKPRSFYFKYSKLAACLSEASEKNSPNKHNKYLSETIKVVTINH